MSASLYHGDCLDVLRTLPDDSVESIVCDPPYELGFMGKRWDATGIAYRVDLWSEALRVLKPGGQLLAFGGTRTYHRMACAIEDAGFEIRDSLHWVYGSGFPKSLDVSKQLDQQERNRWLQVCKAIDNTPKMHILELWKRYSSNANRAEIQFRKSLIETGTSTQRNDIAPALVVLPRSLESSLARAINAELSSSEVPPIDAAYWSSALLPAAAPFMESSGLANSAESSHESQEAQQGITDSSARCDAWAWLNESITSRLKADEALKIWLGSNQSSRQAATSALCAALTDDLKLIILSRSRTFQSLDTTSQMACVSATTATITESTAGSLISYTVATLRSKAIDRAAGAEREVIYRGAEPGREGRSGSKKMPHPMDWGNDAHQADQYVVTAPATDAADQWSGWGTALKPAHEPIVLARKPLAASTIAAQVLATGCGALNIAATRVQSGQEYQDTARINAHRFGGVATFPSDKEKPGFQPAAGRWPPNLLLSHAPGCTCVGVTRVKGTRERVEATGDSVISKTEGFGIQGGRPVGFTTKGYADADGRETVADWRCVGGCPVAELGRQSGERPTGKPTPGTQATTGAVYGTYAQRSTVGGGDTGTAARFFPTFAPDDAAPMFYCAKASRAERNRGCEGLPEDDTTPRNFVGSLKWINDARHPDGGYPANPSPPKQNTHPTVKPIALMRWLCRLITPPGGTVLDPFLGSGSTGVAALEEGFSFIGIEKDPDYLAIAQARIDHAHPSAREAAA